MAIDDLKSKEKVYDFLQTHSVAIISTVSPDGKPSASPIYFITDKQLNFFFVTKSDTKKAQNIELNKYAAVTIVDPTLLITIQTTGSVEEVQEPEMFAKISEANALQKADFKWPPPLSKLQRGGYLLMFKFTPDWLRVGDFSEVKEKTDTQKNIYHQIIPSKSA